MRLIVALVFIALGFFMFMINVYAQEPEIGTVACTDCACKATSECVYCCDENENNQAAFSVINYELYDINDCTKCRISAQSSGIFPLNECLSLGVKYADENGNWISASCSTKATEYKLPLEGSVYFADEFGFGGAVCPEPPTREFFECGYYRKEVYCDTSEFIEGGDLFEPTWNTLVLINYPEARSCVDANLQICGNGMKEGNEQCDDGNLNNGDGCSSTCILETRDEEGNENMGEYNKFDILRNILIIIGVLLLGAILYYLLRKFFNGSR